MPNYRVIGGPNDGAVWKIDAASDEEWMYTRANEKDPVEHIYELCTKDQTARYVKARRFRKELEG